jgi:two-component system, cell cycle sensor histidine kinase and response regulator CckA
LDDLRILPRTRELVGEIKKAGKRAESLTRQLLAFSRKTVLEPKVLNLNDIIASSARMLQRIVGEDVQITTQLAPGLDNVKVDPHQIEHAIVNLAVNARDAMLGGGRLNIQTRNVQFDASDTLPHPGLGPGRYVMLVISDTGCGMSHETTARIFEPFFTTKGIGQGTGLGLSAVCGIVEQSGGQITVDSDPGQGTTFKIYLPPTGEQLPAIKPPPMKQPHNPKASCHGSEHVLLVEDDPAVRMIARLALQTHGYQVREASNGEEAIRVWQQHQDSLQVLVTDVVMPGLSGREVAEQLRVKNPAMKVLFLSGYNEDEVIRRGGLQGAAFLQKPFNSTALATKVREVLDSIS